MTGRPGGSLLRRLLMPALAVVALLAYWTHVAPRGVPPVTPVAQAETQDVKPYKVWGPSVGFETARKLDEHYDKHGAEFGHITKQDYLHQAQLLRDSAVGGPVIEARRANGGASRFDKQTGAFIAFNRDGTIRTFFRPNDGERYFRRQAERGEE
jgi:pyocin large subunit-like protein